MAYSRISMQALHSQKIGVNCITGQKVALTAFWQAIFVGFGQKAFLSCKSDAQIASPSSTTSP